LEPVAQTWIEANLQDPIELEPVTPEICAEGCGWDDFHGDPAARSMVTTAPTLGTPILTLDR